MKGEEIVFSDKADELEIELYNKRNTIKVKFGDITISIFKGIKTPDNYSSDQPSVLVWDNPSLDVSWRSDTIDKDSEYNTITNAIEYKWLKQRKEKSVALINTLVDAKRTERKLYMLACDEYGEWTGDNE